MLSWIESSKKRSCERFSGYIPGQQKSSTTGKKGSEVCDGVKLKLEVDPWEKWRDLWGERKKHQRPKKASKSL